MKLMSAMALGAALLLGCGEGGGTEVPTAQVPNAPVDSMAKRLAALDQRIVNDPSDASAYADRAAYFASIDSTRRALADMDRALDLDSNKVEYLLRAGDLNYAVLNVERARQRFTRAGELVPDDPRPRLKLAEIELVLRHYKESMSMVNEALRKDPNVAHGYYLKGWIHMETRDTNLALSSFRTAVEQDPQDYDAYLMLAKLSAARRDPLAEQYYSTAIDLRPGQVEAIYNQAIYYQEVGKDSLALACYDRIQQIDPQNPLAWYNRGWVRLEHLNDPGGAKKDFDKAIELQTNYADAWYNRGVAMERTQEPDSAAANYQICLTIDPGHTLAAMGLDRLAKQGIRIKLREKGKQPGGNTP
jgi:tetratricopeptide (TPR) repeat protein